MPAELLSNFPALADILRSSWPETCLQKPEAGFPEWQICRIRKVHGNEDRIGQEKGRAQEQERMGGGKRQEGQVDQGRE